MSRDGTERERAAADRHRTNQPKLADKLALERALQHGVVVFGGSGPSEVRLMSFSGPSEVLLKSLPSPSEVPPRSLSGPFLDRRQAPIGGMSMAAVSGAVCTVTAFR